MGNTTKESKYEREISMLANAVKERRLDDERVRYNWGVVADLYNYGYTTKDISTIYGTSSGSIARGLTGIVQKRRRGVPSMQAHPATFSAEFNQELKDDGIYDIVHAYYDRVAVLLKASYIEARKGLGESDAVVAEKLGIGTTQLASVTKAVERYMKPYEQGIKSTTEEQGQHAKRAQILRESAQRNQEAFAIATRSIR